MTGPGFLSNYQIVQTRDVDRILLGIAAVYRITNLDMPEAGRRFDCTFNHCDLRSISLSYLAYGSPIRFNVAQADYFVEGFPMSGTGEVQCHRTVSQVQAEGQGIAYGPGAMARMAYADDFEHLVLKIDPPVLTSKLSAMIGMPIDPPIQLTGLKDKSPSLLAARLRQLRYLISELEIENHALPVPVLEEIEQSVIVAFLYANEHNYTRWLKETPRAAAPWQVRRVVDYVEAYWDQPLTIETLSEVGQTTARSLFSLFKRTYGFSPMTYANQVRLRHARNLLSNPTDATSVTSVGFQCGFSNLGHFAKRYYMAFGEKPSETLRQNR